MTKNFVITVARGFGSGGKEIALDVANRLGIPCYENQILKMASEYSGLSEEIFSKVDERLRGNYLTQRLGKIAFSSGVMAQDWHFHSDINLFCIQAEIIRQLATSASCVIIGKCADHILRDYKNVASFYIEAPRNDCIDSIVRKTGLLESEAEKLIIKTDKYRADYYKFYSGGNYWTNPVNYDLTLNSARIGRKKCVEVIINLMKIKFGQDFMQFFEGKI